jgi:hypothetical protein
MSGGSRYVFACLVRQILLEEVQEANRQQLNRSWQVVIFQSMHLMRTSNTSLLGSATFQAAQKGAGLGVIDNATPGYPLLDIPSYTLVCTEISQDILVCTCMY